MKGFVKVNFLQNSIILESEKIYVSQRLDCFILFILGIINGNDKNISGGGIRENMKVINEN